MSRFAPFTFLLLGLLLAGPGYAQQPAGKEAPAKDAPPAETKPAS
ncbi:hypothetical protein [Hymenobacter cellulosilyticus]|nr:hypothetical protein [Hymenobacter cellulosilyticus]